MKINKKEFTKWITALRNGKYKQGIGRLQGEDGFCCVGVACNELIKRPNKDAAGYLLGYFVEHQSDKIPKWLDYVLNDFDRVHDTLGLPTLNDSGYTFNEIADLLELTYIHKALQ
jgi:hypothetical protein